MPALIDRWPFTNPFYDRAIEIHVAARIVPDIKNKTLNRVAVHHVEQGLGKLLDGGFVLLVRAAIVFQIQGLRIFEVLEPVVILRTLNGKRRFIARQRPRIQPLQRASFCNRLYLDGNHLALGIRQREDGTIHVGNDPQGVKDFGNGQINRSRVEILHVIIVSDEPLHGLIGRLDRDVSDFEDTRSDGLLVRLGRRENV